MDKLFLLGLCVLYLSRGWGLLSRILMKDYDEVEGVACHVCKRYVNGRCLENEDACVTELPSGCETKVFYLTINGVWQVAHTMLNCNSRCKEIEGVEDGMYFKLFCCHHDFCNKPSSGGTYN